MVAMSDKTERENSLIDLILEKLGQNLVRNPIFVGHKWPDDDTLGCFYAAKKTMLGMANAKFLFLNAGETVQESEKDPNAEYIYFDTGRSEYDHHEKGLGKTSSMAVLIEKLHLFDDPETKAGFEPILKMVTAVDNIEPRKFTDLHYLIEGYPRQFNNGRIDWDKCIERVFEAFDIIYAQGVNREKNRQEFQIYRGVKKTSLSNGLKVTSVGWKPGLREAAFEDGAAVVIWHISKGPGKFYTGIQRNREYPSLFLDILAASLRRAEANARKMGLEDASSVGRRMYWYLHDSKALILNGGKTYKLSEEEFSKLSPDEIYGIVVRVISMISRQTVVGKFEAWKEVVRLPTDQIFSVLNRLIGPITKEKIAKLLN